MAIMGPASPELATRLWIALEALIFLVLAGLAVTYLLGAKGPVLPLVVFVAFAGLLVARRLQRRLRLLNVRQGEKAPRSD